jgi:hypothetical protein
MQRSVALVEDSAKADAGGIAVHHERYVEVRHLENGSVVSARWRAANAIVASSSQEKVSRRRRRVSGAVMRPKSRMYFR